jgi:hypothetical protein
MHEPRRVGAEPAAVTACIAALAGFFMYGSLQPPPPGLAPVSGCTGRRHPRMAGAAIIPPFQRPTPMIVGDIVTPNRMFHQ